jgi:hypothetical protein
MAELTAEQLPAVCEQTPSDLAAREGGLTLMTIADEVDSQLTQAMDSYMGVVRKPSRKFPSLNGLCITIRSAIHEWPHTIWRPLERSLPDDSKGFGQLG